MQKHPDRFIGCFVYNPRYGVLDGVAELDRHVKEYGFKMLQLHANMHAYRPDRAKDWVRPALRKAEELGLLVKLHTGDGPYSIPTEWVPLIKEFPRVDFIMAHFGVQTGGVYCFEPFQWAMELPNVYCESGGACSRASWNSPRICRSTRSCSGRTRRRNEPGMWLRHLEVLCMEPPQGMNLDEETLEGYLGNNVARMIGLKI